MEVVDGINVRKVRFMYWESEVPKGNSIYYFPAYTKQGAVKKAKEFKGEQK